MGGGSSKKAVYAAGEKFCKDGRQKEKEKDDDKDSDAEEDDESQVRDADAKAPYIQKCLFSDDDYSDDWAPLSPKESMSKDSLNIPSTLSAINRKRRLQSVQVSKRQVRQRRHHSVNKLVRSFFLNCASNTLSFNIVINIKPQLTDLVDT